MRDLPFVRNRIQELTSLLGDINLKHQYYEEENPNGENVFSVKEAESWLDLETERDIAREMGVSRKLASKIFKAFWPSCGLALFNSKAQGRVSFKKNIRALKAYRLMEDYLLRSNS